MGSIVGGELNMQEYKFRCFHCGMIVTSNTSFPNAQLGGRCPRIASGNHSWTAERGGGILNKENIFAGALGLAAGYMIGKEAEKKEEESKDDSEKSFSDEIEKELEGYNAELENQKKPIIYRKDKNTLKMLKKRK